MALVSAAASRSPAGQSILLMSDVMVRSPHKATVGFTSSGQRGDGADVSRPLEVSRSRALLWRSFRAWCAGDRANPD